MWACVPSCCLPRQEEVQVDVLSAEARRAQDSERMRRAQAAEASAQERQRVAQIEREILLGLREKVSTTETPILTEKSVDLKDLL